MKDRKRDSRSLYVMLSCICVEGLRKITNGLSYNILKSVRSQNAASSEILSTALPLDQHVHLHANQGSYWTRMKQNKKPPDNVLRRLSTSAIERGQFRDEAFGLTDTRLPH
jgi:hypothetical protein